MLKQLVFSKRFSLPKSLLNELKTRSYFFNSSLIINKPYKYIAFRAFDEKTKTIIALLYIIDSREEMRCINLSEYFLEAENIKKVADPKLFLMDGKTFCTFNTGDATEVENKLFLVELNELGVKEYYTCDYEDRMRTEKNWAFYKKDDQLYALYSLSPLTILKAKQINKTDINFELFFIDETQNFVNHSIGTQLVSLNDSLGFIAHKKYYRKRKRLYVGKPCQLNLEKAPIIKVNNRILVHSLKSMLGDKHKFNKNLISCTYFTGIQKTESELILSYGINDVAWNIAVVKANKIWH